MDAHTTAEGQIEDQSYQHEIPTKKLRNKGTKEYCASWLIMLKLRFVYLITICGLETESIFSQRNQPPCPAFETLVAFVI